MTTFSLRPLSNQVPFVPQLDVSVDLAEQPQVNRVAGVDSIVIKGSWLTASIRVEKVPSSSSPKTSILGTIEIVCTDGVTWNYKARSETRTQMLNHVKDVLQSKVFSLHAERVAYNRRLAHAWALSRAAGVPTPYDLPVDDIVGEPYSKAR
jgi:hypothetical protein